MSETKIKKKRITILDELRGFTVLLMVTYHAAYTFGYIFNLPIGYTMLSVLYPIHYAIPVPFVFISGICTKLSRSNLRRGLLLLIPALLINIVTIFMERYITDIAIYFGVINMLSIVMILYGLFEKHLEKLPSRIAFIIFMILFPITWGIKKHYLGIFGIKLFYLPEILYTTKFLFPVGFPDSDFVSSDYFPLIPWFFLFLSGAYFADIIKNKPSVLQSEKLYATHSRILSFIGKKALYIYIVHQPIICGLTYVILLLFQKGYN